MAKASVHERCTTINAKENELLTVFRQLENEDQNFYFEIMSERLESRKWADSIMTERGISEDAAYQVLIDMRMAKIKDERRAQLPAQEVCHD